MLFACAREADESGLDTVWINDWINRCLRHWKDIFRKAITEADPSFVLDNSKNSPSSAFLVGQQAAQSMLASPPGVDGHRGTIIFTNASAALKGFPKIDAFAIACHGKSG